MNTTVPAHFGATSTTDEVLDGIDLLDKRVLVAHGAHVIGTARDLDKARRATSGVNGPGKLDLVECDLAALASVRACAVALDVMGGTFDVVIANAGVMAVPEKRETADGFELQSGMIMGRAMA